MTARRRPADRPGRVVRDRPGVPAERTEMAWERTAVGLLATAVLLMLRHVAPLTSAKSALLGGYLLLGLVVTGVGVRRGRQIRGLPAGRGAPVVVPEARGALVLGVGVAVLGAATALVLLLEV
jgi:uncharacterized membrane protein YidH (DUF202 family)